MSWLAKSIADTLSLNDEEPDPNPTHSPPSPNQPSPRGVKEDLSEITQTLTRQFWGVASFLAPPPPPNPNQSSPRGIPESDAAPNAAGIRSDLVEIGGRFRSGFSNLTGNIKVGEITKIATDFIQKAVEEMNEEAARGVVGVSDEVVAFVKDLSMHPETWLDFPLIQDDDDDIEEEFDMSDAQQEHALAVERLAPSLAALRMELCPEHISESCFWKIYFVLLHPKLDKEVAVILSTPQVMEARALLTTELQNHLKVKQDNNLSTTSVDQKDSLQQEVSLSVPSVPEKATQNVVVSKPNSSSETSAVEKHSPKSVDIQVVEKSAISTTTDKHPIADSQTDKHPIADSQTDKHPMADSQTDKHPIADSQTDKHPIADSQTDKHPIAPSDIQIVDKSVIEVEHNDRNKHQNVQPGPSNTWDNEEDEDDDHDDWLKEETSELGGGASETTIPIDNDEDVSFSDLEDDDVDAPSTLKKVNDTSDKDSRDWVQL